MDLTKKPTLHWVDLDEIVEIAKKRFGKSVSRAAGQSLTEARVEPTLSVVRAVLTETPLAESEFLNSMIDLTKTIQNAVGLFHQDVLGAVEGWESSGASGGLVDLKGYSPVTGRMIVAELKMRYNTIKGSDQMHVWDSLDNAVKLSGGDTTGYIFQIVPKNPSPYDRPWQVSNRKASERVRCADGVTAYHLVTGHPNAFFELLQALPWVMSQVTGQLLGSSKSAETAMKSGWDSYSEVIALSLPSHSAHAGEPETLL